MAQLQPERKMEETPPSPVEKVGRQNEIRATTRISNSNGTTLCCNAKCNSSGINNSASNGDTGNGGTPFKFNPQAPEFVPGEHIPIPGCYYPWFNYFGVAQDWFPFGDHYDLVPSNSAVFMPDMNRGTSGSSSKNASLGNDLRNKIVKQVEYQFSDMSLLANESMSRHVSKDPDGYVPISVIASTKKIKSLVNNIQLLTQALYSSPKLLVNADGTKVKRKMPFTDRDRDELQSRTVVVENLPEDHSHQNLEKICNVVGSVKTIRICHPQESPSLRSKSDYFVSNKIHALVEFESPDIAERAVEKLNDERNWRKGIKVRLMLRCSPKSVLKNRRSEFNGFLEDDDDKVSELQDDSPHSTTTDCTIDCFAEDSPGAQKKGWSKGRGKAKTLGQTHAGRGLHCSSPKAVGSSEAAGNPVSKGPRMPDGSKGFTMGRGKPLCPLPTSTPTVE